MSAASLDFVPGDAEGSGIKNDADRYADICVVIKRRGHRDILRSGRGAPGFEAEIVGRGFAAAHVFSGHGNLKDTRRRGVEKGIRLRDQTPAVESTEDKDDDGSPGALA